MDKISNIIPFPNKPKESLEDRKKKYVFIRDEIESILSKYSKVYGDEWAVILAAGRFSSMKLQQIEGTDNTLNFFKRCIETQANKNISQ
tara:strand:- start:183 stop:449 length:267 start_codon:yes stop_codon:yes gene_type:complete